MKERTRSILIASSGAIGSVAMALILGAATQDWELWTNIIQPFPRMRLGTNGFYYYEDL